MFKFMLSAINSRISGRKFGAKNTHRASLDFVPRSRPRMNCVELETRINPVTVINYTDTTAAGSLRAAIIAINMGTTAPIIDFLPGQFGPGALPIELTSNLPKLMVSTTIIGFSDNTFVTIDADFKGSSYDVFATEPNAKVNVDVSGLTILGSNRGMTFDGGTHIVSNVRFLNGVTNDEGAAIGIFNGDVTISDSASAITRPANGAGRFTPRGARSGFSDARWTAMCPQWTAGRWPPSAAM